MVSWTVVSEQLCDLVEEETGIKVDPNDISYSIEDELIVLLFDSKLTGIDKDYLEDSDDEDIAYMIFESLDKPAKRVTENKVRCLEGNIQRIVSQIEQEKNAKLSFEIEDRGYLDRARHYLNEQEYMRDYPDLVLVVTSKGKNFEFPIDPYQADEPFDIYELKQKL